MLIQRILKFINDLKSTNNIYDIEAQPSFLNYFIDKDPGATLTTADHNFIMTHFMKRWRRYKHSDMNYTIDTNEDNLLWVEIAKELAPIVKKTYINILFPDVTNSTDPISNEMLCNIVNTDSLFLGYGDRTLYRKKSLCTHLIKSDYVLSTLRYTSFESMNTSPAIMTVDELTRLKSCKLTVRSAFSIGNKDFSSFWDFLNREVFPRLNPTFELPLIIIPNFFLLIEGYFARKYEGSSFRYFKTNLNIFFEFLYKNELKLVNQFYGLRIGAENKFSLLDLLITLNSALDYSVDDQLIEVLKWLYTLSPKLRLDSFSSIYSEHVIAPLLPIVQCKQLLLCLFTFKFECSLWDERIISLSDRTNKVDLAVYEIYKMFEPLIQVDDFEGFLNNYKELLKKANVSDKNDTVSQLISYVSIPSPTPSSYHTLTGSIRARMHSTWYDPKLLIHGLLRFCSTNTSVNSLKDLFLDELVHTYCQSMSKLQCHLRINILFSEFMEKIKKTPDYKVILLVLELHSGEDYKGSFLASCTYHVGSRLKKINVVRTDSPTLFPTTHKMDSLSLITTELELKRVSEIIATYKEQIKMINNIELYEKLLDYLQTLCAPILTHKEKLEIERSAQVADPIGAPT